MGGWLLTAAVVAGWDVYALKTGRRTMSNAFAHAWTHPARKWPTLAAWAYLSSHLFGVLPHEWDPLHRIAAALTPNGRDDA